MVSALILHRALLGALCTTSLARVSAASHANKQQPFFASLSRHFFSGMASPDQSGDHGIPLEGKRKQVVEDAMKLFQSKASLEILSRSWAPDAGFEDPIALCRGFKEYAPQWFGMKVFPKSETLEWKVVTNEPNLIEYEQTQKYTIPGVRTTKVMKSLVHMQLDDEGKIKHFEDRWDHKPLPKGSIAVAFRRLNANVMPWLISVPKEDKKAS